MGFDPDSAKAWRDFVHTAKVLLASALARHEMARHAVMKTEAAGSAPVRVFEFELLAAASRLEMRFEGGEVLARGGGLKAVIAELDGELNVKLQLLGYSTLKQAAGREARLVSDNGAIDYAFRFSKTGAATCVLANTVEVKQGLGHFTVQIFD